MGDLSRHFSRYEFTCGCGCGFDTVDHGTLTVLKLVRRDFGRPVIINSGCRCAYWNGYVGGEKGSLHMQARAADIAVQGVSSSDVANYLDAGPLLGKGGIGRYATFTHVDTRSDGPARWSG